MDDTSGILPHDTDLDHSTRFVLLEQVSTTGHNLLWKAQRDGRMWMLKGLKPEFSHDAMYRQLLSKEYTVMQQLQHPSVPHVVEMTNVDGLGQCIVMEYIDGETLDQWLADKPVCRLRLRVMETMLDALEYVHQKQIVHRDLKPSNIMVTHNGHNLKIIDFGLADTDCHTILKQPAGTPHYMSPEQMTTNVADARNDIYSLGCILRQMHLGWHLSGVWSRCTADIQHRYQSIHQLRRAIHLRQTMLWLVPLSLTILALLTYILLLHNAKRLDSEMLASVTHSQQTLQLQHQRDSLAISMMRDSLHVMQQKEEEQKAHQRYVSEVKERGIELMKKTVRDERLEYLLNYEIYHEINKEKHNEINKQYSAACDNINKCLQTYIDTCSGLLDSERGALMTIIFHEYGNLTTQIFENRNKLLEEKEKKQKQ